MTEKIQQIIENIRTNSIRFHDELIQAREQNRNLSSDLELLKFKLDESVSLITKLQSENHSLKLDLEAANKQVVNSSLAVKNGRRDEEIDALVKEIEYCITQLKK